jgi:hypothetical protein
MYSIPRAAYGGLLMLPPIPFGVSADLPLTALCATCGHSDFIHSDNGNRWCLYAECGCNVFIVGATLDLRHRSYLRIVASDRRARVPSRRARSSALRRASPRRIRKPVVSATDKEEGSRLVADPRVAIAGPRAASMRQGA